MLEGIEKYNNITGPSEIKIEHSVPEEMEAKPNISDSIKSINFGYVKKGNKSSKLISDLNEKYKGNESFEGLVAQNEQIQILLSEIFSEYGEYIGSDKEKLKKRIEQGKLGSQGEKYAQMIESYDEYLFNNDTEQGFEQFLLSSKCINDVIYLYLSRHTDSQGKINFISKKDIKAKIKAAWKEKLYKDYIVDKQGTSYQELLKLNMMGATIKNSIDKIILNYLNGGGDIKGNEQLTNHLSALLELAQNNNAEDEERKYDKDKINLMLRTSITEYSRLLNLSEKNRKLVSTDDPVFDLQLRSYLFLYGKLFYKEDFQDNKGLKGLEGNLGELLEAILVADGNLKKLRENKFTKREEELRKQQQERDRIIRINTWEKMVSNMQSEHNDHNQDNASIETKAIDIQNASGVEIAREKKLGEGLKKFKFKGEQAETDKRFMQKVALEKTGKQFIVENKGILSEYINNGAELMNFFDLGDGGVSFNRGKWEEFKIKWIKDNPNSNVGELEKIESVLASFPNKFYENINKLNEGFNTKKDNLHETVKDYAIGAVIDNIKDMFENIINSSNSGGYISGFEFNEKESARIENDNLIISGKFNGEVLSLRYDLNSGKLYMNTFINKKGDNGPIVIGGQKPNYEIGTLLPFENILDDFYKNPTDSMGDNIFTKYANATISRPINGSYPGELSQSHINQKEMKEKMKEEHRLKIQKICGTKLDEIGLNIKNEVETKSIQHHTVSNLLKALNIIPDNTQVNNATINLSYGSDLYNVVQLVTNSENTDINHFSNYMQKLMNQIGLTWGKNNEHQNKTQEVSKIIFDDKNKQEYITYVRENTQSFDNECAIARGKAQFDSKLNFGILKIIGENFTDGHFPNWKISSTNIKSFEDKLNAELDLETAFS